MSFLAPGQSVNVLGDTLRLVFSENNGGLFGLFRGQAVVFGLVSLVVVGVIVLYHARAGGSLYLSITLGLLLGGAVGNLIDRLRLGYVVDFVDAGIGSLRWYTFNVADTGISFAIILLLAASLWPSVARRDGGPCLTPRARRSGGWPSPATGIAAAPTGGRPTSAASREATSSASSPTAA